MQNQHSSNHLDQLAKKTKRRGKWFNTSILHMLRTTIAVPDTCNLHYCWLQFTLLLIAIYYLMCNQEMDTKHSFLV